MKISKVIRSIMYNNANSKGSNKGDNSDSYRDKLYKIYGEFLEILYPQNINCILCSRPIKKSNSYSMCKSCFDELNFILNGCGKCGKFKINYSLEKQFIDECNFCHSKTFYFEKAISCIEYNDISKRLILGLKYSSKTYMCKYIAQIMKEKLDIENIKFDYLTYVPLHKKRLKKRGFNQSEKIAKYLVKLIDVPLIDLVVRHKYTEMLYKLKRDERSKELKNAFKINEEINIGNVEDKVVLLLDDVFTTGSTVNEISKVLKLAGVGKVYVITLLTKSSEKYVKDDAL
ncbi:ComF family protein [Metaclostridioides mangenotii]|nr:ComF family protein [Clostridioides mangenotii]